MSSRANMGRHLGGSREEGAEPNCPADSRATGGETTSRLLTEGYSSLAQGFTPRTDLCRL
jgi:hypothetical protein